MHLHVSSTLSECRPQTFIFHPRRAMSYTLQNLTLRTGTPPSPVLQPVSQHSELPCGDQRSQQRGALMETPPLAGYGLNRIAEDRDSRRFAGDGQFTGLQDLRVRPLSFHQSIIASTYESAESSATHPEADLDDEQLRVLLASPLYLQERGASAERLHVCRCERENSMSSSSQDPTSTGKPVAVRSSQKRLNQDTFSDRDEFPRDMNRFLGVLNLSSDSLTRQMLRNRF